MEGIQIASLLGARVRGLKGNGEISLGSSSSCLFQEAKGGARVAGGTGKPPVSDDDIVPPGASKLQLLHNSLLVPEKYDRDIRHYEFKRLGDFGDGLTHGFCCRTGPSCTTFLGPHAF